MFMEKRCVWNRTAFSILGSDTCDRIVQIPIEIANIVASQFESNVGSVYWILCLDQMFARRHVLTLRQLQLMLGIRKSI